MKENKMGTMPIDKLIISMSLPIMISMLVQALYNIVDSIFVAKISEDALTAVSMAFPIQNLMIAIGAGTAVGVNALLARFLGQKDMKKVGAIANNAVFLIFVSYFVFLIVGLFLVKPFFMSQTDIDSIINYGVEYLSICSCLSFGIFVQLFFERMLQATGKTFYTMITQGVGAIVNIILDPILIFGMFGMPRMGVSGAAAATIVGQVVAGILAVVFNAKINKEIKIDLKGFRPDIKIIGQIYGIGVPSIIMQAIGSLANYGMNVILIGFSSTATAVFGVYFKLQSFVFMPLFGLNNGVVPIIAYNYGADSRERVVKTIKHTIFYAVGIMLLGLIVFQLIPGQLLKMFNASENMLEIGIPALRIISISYIFAGFCIACSGAFQAMGTAVYSMFVSIARQLVVLLPVAFALSLLGNVNYIWFAFPIAEIASFTMTIIFLRRLFKKVISKLN